MVFMIRSEWAKTISATNDSELIHLRGRVTYHVHNSKRKPTILYFTQLKKKVVTLNWKSFFLLLFFFKSLLDTCPFVGRGHWYPCFGLLVMSPLGFKARVGSTLFALAEAYVIYVPWDSPLVRHLLPVYTASKATSRLLHMRVSAEVGCRDLKLKVLGLPSNVGIVLQFCHLWLTVDNRVHTGIGHGKHE